MLQLLNPPLPAGVICAGIDVAKAKFDVQLDDARKPFTVPNTPGGRGKLIERLRGLPLARIAVESSGGYERPLLHDLLDAGLPVAHVNPRVVRDYARGFNQQAKTDAIDARVLACYARERQPRLLSGADKLRHMLQDLNRCRRQLLEQITALKNQAEVALHPTAVTVLGASVEVLKPYYQRLTDGGKPPKVALVACMRKLLTHLNAILSDKATATATADGKPTSQGDQTPTAASRGGGEKE